MFYIFIYTCMIAFILKMFCFLIRDVNVSRFHFPDEFSIVIRTFLNYLCRSAMFKVPGNYSMGFTNSSKSLKAGVA